MKVATRLLPRREPNPYASFWMAGFEGADHVNAHGEPQDLVRLTGHLAQLDDDYRRVAALGLGTIRESVGWRLPSRARARRTGHIAAHDSISPGPCLRRCSETEWPAVMWTLDALRFARRDVFADDFPERFADFAARRRGR